MNRKDLFDSIFSKPEKHPLGKYEPDNKKYAKENLPSRHSKPEAQKRLKKQFQKLRHKALYLNMEHEELMEDFQHIRHEFISKMLEYCKNKNIENPFCSVPEENNKKTNIISNKEMNEVFREIVKKTHPDLNKSLTEEELEEKVELYNQAIEGKQDGNFRKVLQVALELNVKIKKISPEFIKQLRQEIQKMNKQIQQIKNDIMYKWGKGDDNLKKQIFELLTKNLKPLK